MLKIGILGAGFVGGTHAAAFARLPDVQIVGISSRSAEKAVVLPAKYGAKPFAAALARAEEDHRW
jgi:UDP-N-acetylglucosamine 3-dehydrogenase